MYLRFVDRVWPIETKEEAMTQEVETWHPSALSLDIPPEMSAEDAELRALAVLTLARGIVRDKELKLHTVPIYCRLRRKLIHDNELEPDALPVWHSSDW